MAIEGASSSERLTWKQSCERYPDEWVVFVESDSESFTLGGTALVIGHFQRRKEASAFIKAAFAQYRSIGCFWTGEIRLPVIRFQGLYR